MSSELTEKEIDKLVIDQAGNPDAWEQPIRVNRKDAFTLSIGKPNEVVSDHEILGGEPVFRGTFVPVAVMLDSLESGTSLDEFLTNFPAVQRHQAIQVLEYFRRSIQGIRKAA